MPTDEAADGPVALLFAIAALICGCVFALIWVGLGVHIYLNRYMVLHRMDSVSEYFSYMRHQRYACGCCQKCALQPSFIWMLSLISFLFLLGNLALLIFRIGEGKALSHYGCSGADGGWAFSFMAIAVVAPVCLAFPSTLHQGEWLCMCLKQCPPPKDRSCHRKLSSGLHEFGGLLLLLINPLLQMINYLVLVFNCKHEKPWNYAGIVVFGVTTLFAVVFLVLQFGCRYGLCMSSSVSDDLMDPEKVFDSDDKKVVKDRNACIDPTTVNSMKTGLVGEETTGRRCFCFCCSGPHVGPFYQTTTIGKCLGCSSMLVEYWLIALIVVSNLVFLAKRASDVNSAIFRAR